MFENALDGLRFPNLEKKLGSGKPAPLRREQSSGRGVGAETEVRHDG